MNEFVIYDKINYTLIMTRGFFVYLRKEYIYIFVIIYDWVQIDIFSQVYFSSNEMTLWELIYSGNYKLYNFYFLFFKAFIKVPFNKNDLVDITPSYCNCYCCCLLFDVEFSWCWRTNLNGSQTFIEGRLRLFLRLDNFYEMYFIFIKMWLSFWDICLL